MEGVEGFIKKWTDGDFEVIKFDEDNVAGETTVIIVFKDVKTAQNFVDAIKDSSDDFNIESISFLSERPMSGATKTEVCFFGAVLAMILAFYL